MVRRISLPILLLILLGSNVAVRAHAATAPLVTSFTRSGWVYGLRADGSTIRLTAGTTATISDLRPNGREVAYFTANRVPDRLGRPILNTVWRVPTRANRQIVINRVGGQGAGALVWSPRGRMLAYADDGDIQVWDETWHDTYPVPLIRGFDPGPGPVLAWGPGGNRLAVPLPALSNLSPPKTMSVMLINPAHRSTRTVLVRFPRILPHAGILNPHPDVGEIGWTADGRHLLVATTLSGAGHVLSGVWTVRDRGGMARLLVTTLPGPVGSTGTRSLAQAAAMAVAPDGRKLAIATDTMFWVAGTDGQHGRLYPAGLPRGCAITTFRWLSDGSGLAYVTNCTVAGTPSIRANLYLLPLSKGRARLVTSAIGRQSLLLSGTSTGRCIACG